MAETDSPAAVWGLVRPAQHANRVGVGQVSSEGVQGGGEELPQRRAQPVDLALTVPMAR